MSSYKTTLSRNQEIFNFPCIFGLRDGGAGNGMKLLRVFRVVRVARLLRTLAIDEMLKIGWQRALLEYTNVSVIGIVSNT